MLPNKHNQPFFQAPYSFIKQVFPDFGSSLPSDSSLVPREGSTFVKLDHVMGALFFQSWVKG